MVVLFTVGRFATRQRKILRLPLETNFVNSCQKKRKKKLEPIYYCFFFFFFFSLGSLLIHLVIWEPLRNGDKRSPTYLQTTIYSNSVRFAAKECPSKNPFTFSCAGNYNFKPSAPRFRVSIALSRD